MIYEISGTEEIRKLFGDWQETCIWSCLQGVMGRLYADAVEKPKSAMAILGDFCFFAGEPNRNLVSYKPEWREQNFIIMTANSPGWFPLVEQVYGEAAKKVSRYAFKKDMDGFDKEKLRHFAQTVDVDFRLSRMDEKLFEACRKQDWSKDFVAQYRDYEEYKRIGLGVVAQKDGELVAGASSYSSYEGGIEIEIDTKAEYRRRGLATACGAELILACLEHGIYPSWDAQNLWSVALAEKLGYHFDHEYTAYEVYGY